MKRLIYILFIISLFTAVANGQEGKWELINQNPKVEQYKHTLKFESVEFFDDNIGFACTADGKIYKTETRAQDWDLIFQNDNILFAHIDFREDFLGFAIGIDKTKPAGENAVLLLTEDCGNSWKPLPTPDNAVFNTSCLVTSSIDVIFGDINGNLYLLNTNTLTVEGRLEFFKVYEMKEANKNHFSSIVKTKDSYFVMITSYSDNFILMGDNKGKNWKKIQLPKNVNLIRADAIDDIAYAISQGGRAIYSITNKEGVVTKLYEDENVKLNSIAIQRKDMVVACGDDGLILYSTDEGKTWNKVQQKFDKSFQMVKSGEDRSFVIADALVLTKDNNRDEWYDPTSAVNNPNFSQLYRDTLKCVYFINDKVGFFVGNVEKKLFRTFDGCKTFDTLSFKDQGWYVKQRYNTISFTDDKEGVIMSDFTEAIHTKDGGKTWENKHFSGPKIRRVNTLLFKRPHVFCAESNGRSYRSDFEDVYHHMYLIGDFGEGTDALSVDCYDDVPVAVGENRSYVRDQNYNIELPAVKDVKYDYPENLTCIKMGKDAGFIVSTYGIIYRTTDNGLSWGVAGKFDAPLYSLHYHPQRPKEIYVVGDGIILNSKDNGKSWKKDLSGLDVKLDDIKLRSVFVTDNSVYAVGVNNLILRKDLLSSVVETDTTAEEVYPNPATDEITIPNAGNKPVKIVDITGKTVLETKANNGKVKVDTLPEGMYNAVVDNKSYKFMKQ